MWLVSGPQPVHVHVCNDVLYCMAVNLYGVQFFYLKIFVGAYSHSHYTIVFILWVNSQLVNYQQKSQTLNYTLCYVFHED